MKAVRVLSVSPTFHKLDSGVQNPAGASPPPPQAPPATPSLMPLLPQPRGFFLPSRGGSGPTLASCPPQPRVPSLDGLQLAERRQTFREDSQDPLLDLPACGRRWGGGASARGRARGGGGGAGLTADEDLLHRLVLGLQLHLHRGPEEHVLALQTVEAARPRQALIVCKAGCEGPG